MMTTSINFTHLGSKCQVDSTSPTRDLLENVDVSAAIAGQLDDVHIQTITVDLSALASLLDDSSDLSSRISEAVQVSGRESISPGQRVFADNENEDTVAVEAANSGGITRLANELVAKLMSGIKEIGPGVYESGTNDSVLLKNVVYGAPDVPSLSFSESDIEQIVAEIIELAAPGTDPTTEDINLVIINCPVEGCTPDFLSSLNKETLAESVTREISSLYPSNSEAPAKEELEHGDVDNCNLMVVNIGEEVPTEVTVNDVRSFLSKHNVRCVATVCPVVELEDNYVRIESCERGVDGVCEFSCPAGMDVNGPQNITCRPDGVWTDISPICVPIPCVALNETNHMQINWDRCESIANTSCEFGCEDGWELVGPESIECDINGQWTASAPLCREISCPSLTIANGTNTSCPATQQTTCNFECIEGFEMIGPSEIDCSIRGRWSVNPPICKEPECNPLNDPTDGVVNCYGTTCVFTCDDGYHLNGPSTVVCRPGGLWSETSPSICTQAEPLCSAPEAPQNGMVSNCGQKVGETCTISCNYPYKAVGAINLDCRLGARWSDVPAECVPAEYFIGDAPMEAQDAVDWCSDHNGVALKIESQEHNNDVVTYLQDNFPDKMVWIGASDKIVEGQWKWEDGGPIGFNQWMELIEVNKSSLVFLFNSHKKGRCFLCESHPIPDTQAKEYDCAAIWNRQEYEWVTVCCDESLYAMCEYTG
ncbi:P-selectin [Nymphon striatum]|nr:P-selectin [Nymphon striatum]